MPSVCREYAEKLNSGNDRQLIFNLIVNSHCELMEIFYLNYNTEVKDKNI